jgi:hypothetical protein
MLHRMEARGNGSLLPTGRRGVWRRPPRTVPRSRRPRLWRSPEAIYTAALVLAISSGPSLASVRSSVEIGQPDMTIPIVVLVAAPFAYGVALLATSRRGSRRVLSPVGYGTTPSVRVWLGLAIVLPVVLESIGAAFFVPPTPSGSSLWSAFFYFSPPGLVGIGCVLVGDVVSMRAIKATIVAGLAPTFVTSPDHLWWWDGSQWFGVPSVAPMHALHSPDGNYWWTGDLWYPMPALPPRKPRSSPSTSAA